MAVETTSAAVTHRLLGTDKLASLPLHATLAPARAVSIGVIRGLCPNDPTEKLTRGLESEVPVDHMRRFSGGRYAELFFGGPLPATVLIYDIEFVVEARHVRPTQCWGCGRFGHVQSACTLPTACPSCRGRHLRGKCAIKLTPICPNCKCRHAAFDKGCSVYQQHKREAEAVRDTGCSWKEAKRVAAELQKKKASERGTQRVQEQTAAPPSWMHCGASQTPAWQTSVLPASSVWGETFPTLEACSRPNAVKTREASTNTVPSAKIPEVGKPQRRKEIYRKSYRPDSLQQQQQQRGGNDRRAADARHLRRSSSPRAGDRPSGERERPLPQQGQWNANGLGDRLTHLRAELLPRPYEVLLLQEPRMDVSKITIPSYTTYLALAGKNNPGRAVLVHKDTTHCRIESADYCSDTSELEALAQTDLGYSGTGQLTFIGRGVEQSVLDLTFCSVHFPLTTVLEQDSWGSDHIPITSGPVSRPPNRTCKVVHMDRYRAFLRQYEAMGWPLDSQAIGAALKEATMTTPGTEGGPSDGPSRGHTPVPTPGCTVQETWKDAEGHLDERFRGWARCYTDGSVDPDARTAMAAADLGSSAAERLSFSSSTTDELAAMRLALSMAEAESPPGGLVLLSDSKAALTQLANLDRASPLGREFGNSAILMQRRGWTLAFQWLPAHCGIGGNKAADRLAATAQRDEAFPTYSMAALSDARLRTNSGFTPTHLARWSGRRDSPCLLCREQMRTIGTLYCDVARERAELRQSYAALGCTTDTWEDVIRPGRPATNLAKLLVETHLDNTI
ncbi:hypothetical protein ISCGN_023074 [Ixodes scapularis]